MRCHHCNREVVTEDDVPENTKIQWFCYDGCDWEEVTDATRAVCLDCYQRHGARFFVDWIAMRLSEWQRLRAKEEDELLARWKEIVKP